jgi:hypothetical protein
MCLQLPAEPCHLRGKRRSSTSLIGTLRCRTRYISKQEHPIQLCVRRVGSRVPVLRPRGHRRRARGNPPKTYLVSKGPGFRVRLRAELLREDLPAPLELPESRGAPPCACEESHQAPVGAFFQRVEGKGRAGPFDRRLEPSGSRIGVDDLLEGCRAVLSQALLLHGLPLIE